MMDDGHFAQRIAMDACARKWEIRISPFVSGIKSFSSEYVGLVYMGTHTH